MTHPLRNILNGLLWTGKECVLAYVHRGAEGDLAIIKTSEIAKVGKSWFALKGSEAIIPFHRIAWIKEAGTGRIIWEGLGEAARGSGASGQGRRRRARRAPQDPP